MEVIDTPIGDVKPYENNPRNNDHAVAKVAESIRDFGWQQPIVVDANNVVIAGYARLRAAHTLGLNDVPVLVAKDLDETKVVEFRPTDNRSAHETIWNNELLALKG